MIIIAALSNTGVIGTGSGLPWNLPDEYQHFLDQIRGQTIIMGRRSYQIFGPDLTAKDVVVLSRSAKGLAGATVVSSLENALSHARGSGREIFCGGGAAVYRMTLPLADEMRLSFVEGSYRGEYYFPTVDWGAWDLVRRESNVGWEYRVYRRDPGYGAAED